MRLPMLVPSLFVATLTGFAGCGSSSQSGDAAVPLDMHIPGPTMLASAQTLTNCLATDGSFVYWADYAGGTATVQKVPVSGGAAEQVIAGGDKNGCVAVDANGVYYVEGDKIMKAALAGGGAAPLATGQHVLRGPVVAGGYVYFITDVYGNVDAFNGKNAIVRLATSGGGGVQVVSAEVMGLPGALAVDDTSVYYSDNSGAWSRALALPTAVVSFGGNSPIHSNSMAVGAGHVAVAEVQAPGTGDVAVFRSDGMGRVVVASSLAQPLAVDDKGVYLKAAAFDRAALDGSATVTLAAQPPRALALATDRIYFTDGSAIYSLPR